MGMMDRFKKKQDDQAKEEGLDILTDVREPFSFAGFFDTQVVERCRRAKNIMQEKGILFFLFSPFQARSRLIAQMLILCIGVLFGVVPRASNMIGELQNQAYASEIAGLSEQMVGSLRILPAASSNYKRMHMLAFLIEGKDLPSDPDRYEVHLARGYGASDWEDVTYSWMIYPVTNTTRILLVAIDQTKQASGYGAFDLYIQLSGEEVKDYAKTPFEITLSSAQETTNLYDKTGVHLSALTEAVCGRGDIAEKQKEFEEAVSKYQIAVEQAENMPADIHVKPTAEDLETFCLSNRIYRALDDDSTTEDILSMDEVSDSLEFDLDVVITSEGIPYDADFVNEIEESKDCTDTEKLVADAVKSVSTAKDSVIGAMKNVNTAAMSWYSTLSSYKLILNQTILPDTFPLYARVTNTISDEIRFLDGTVSSPPEEDEDGLTGTMTGDDTEEPKVKEPADAEDDPLITDEPVTEPEEEPEDEKPAAEESEDEPESSDSEEEKPVTEEEPSGVEGSSSGVNPETSVVSSDPADSK